MNSAPVVSVIVPVRNEVRHATTCISHIAGQSYPLDLIEVIVVDGASEDGSRAAFADALARFAFRRAEVVTNPSGTTPSNLNMGLGLARGDIICRVDARSFVPPGYVGRCVEILTERPEVAVVGGAQVPRAGETGTVVERGVARALTNPWATGLARYRRGASSGPTDTVYLGAFRARDLRSVGGWDLRFATNQDYELNRRMGQVGTVWFEAGIDVIYVPRATLGALARQYRRFGRWKAAGWLEAGVPISSRQVVLLAAPPAVVVVAGLLLRRRPLVTLVIGLAGLAAIDGRGGPAPPADRGVSIIAIPLLGGSWWLGTLEQALRFVAGQRLVGPR